MGFFKSKAEKEKERLERQRQAEVELIEKYNYIKENTNAKKICEVLTKHFSDIDGEKLKWLRKSNTYDVNIFYNGIKIVPTSRALLNMSKLMYINHEEEEVIVYSDLGIENVPTEYMKALIKYFYDELSKLSYIKVYENAFGLIIAPGDNIKASW